jgi:Flp pilus assembly protein TadG
MLRRTSSSQSGQVLIIFAFAFIVILMMLALVFDGANGLLLRRQMQNASDAAAMAGANLIQGLSTKGCSATPGSPPGAPQAVIVAAAKASVAANLPDYDPANVLVTCPDGWDDGQGNGVAVQVQLLDQAPTFFGSIFGGGPLDVASRSTAVNGQNSDAAYSVILLDDHIVNVSWPNGRNGCPSFLLSGGPTVQFDSSIYIDSACNAVDGGAMSTNGNATSLTIGNGGPAIRIVGEYKPQALTITPAPMEHQNKKDDPLAFLQAPPGSRTFASNDLLSLKLQKPSKYVVGQGQSSSTVILEPGVYKGGIQLKNSSIAYLRPGIYVLQGGGLDLGAQTKLYAIPANANNTTDATWATQCTSANCGILIYNTGDDSGSLTMGPVTVAAGATFKVRSYDPTASVTLRNSGAPYTNATYESLLIWQSAVPAATGSQQGAQPVMHLNGGGSVIMSGAIYAPQGKVLMGGTSGGSGGGPTITLTLQFIVWDLELSGNASFHFVYDGREFPVPLDYGLVQ